MKSSYKLLGPYIREINLRNTEGKEENLLGVSTNKIFIQSIANTVGTNFKKYKIVNHHQFTYVPDTSRRGDRIGIALLVDYQEALVSSAYTVFEIINHEELLPEYLMMWFRRPEFDRYARFKSHGSVREMFDWEEMCSVDLPVPDIEKQKVIVKEYNTIANRIKLNEELNRKLEETAQAIYKQWFVDNIKGKLENKTLGDLCSLITDGKHGDCQNEVDSGYYFLSAKDLRNNTLIFMGARQITKVDFKETHKRTDLKPGDICMVNTGATIGRIAIAPNKRKTINSTFQKSVAILKPRNKIAKSYYLYCLLKFKIRDIIELASGTSQPNLLLGDLKSFSIQYPRYTQVVEFENKVTPIFQKQQLNTQENIKLNELKEIVLSKITRV